MRFRSQFIVVYVIISLGFALRLYALDSESLWYDELLQLDIAQGPLSELPSQLTKHAALPLDYLISHVWITLGRSETWVRLPAVLLGTLTLPLAYQLGRKLLDGATALVLLGLLAVSPLHIYYSQEVRPYALLVLGVFGAGYGFWQLRRTGRWLYGGPLIGGCLIFSLAHFFGTVIFLPWLLFSVVDVVTARRQDNGHSTPAQPPPFDRLRRQPARGPGVILPHWQRRLRAGGTLLAAGAMVLAVMLSLGWGRTLWNVTWWGFGQAIVEPERFTLEAEEKPNAGSGPRVDDTFVRNEVLTPLGANRESGTAFRLFNIVALLGLAYLLIQKRYKISLLLLLWLILPVIVIVAFLVYRGSFYDPRYIISVLPAYLILVAVGILALPRWLRCAEPRWLSPGALLLLGGLVIANSWLTLQAFYTDQGKEDWRLVSRVIAQNARPDEAIIAVNAEATLNWYYPVAAAASDRFDTLAAVQAKVAEAERSWVVMSTFAQYVADGPKIRRWLKEQGAVKLVLDPLIHVYYVGPLASPPQLLAEVRDFALPVDHVLYAELGRQNRREPAVARQYFSMAIDSAPTDEFRAGYEAEIEALFGKQPAAFSSE